MDTVTVPLGHPAPCTIVVEPTGPLRGPTDIVGRYTRKVPWATLPPESVTETSWSPTARVGAIGAAWYEIRPALSLPQPVGRWSTTTPSTRYTSVELGTKPLP